MVNKRVLIVGSAEKSGGGISSVIQLMKKMPMWDEYSCYWLGTQIQRNYLWKLWYAIKANFTALFILWKFDIVHFHTVPDKAGLIIQLPVLLLSLIGKKKIIMHVHVGNQLKKHTENKLFKWCLKHADIIVLLAKRWEMLFKEKYSDIEVPTIVVYNACEPVPQIHSFREKRIIFVGYMDDNKAPNLLLESIAQLKSSAAINGWKVSMLGNGDVERFEKMSEELNVQDIVEFTGYISGKQKEEYFRKASCLVLCSYNEGFPMVVLEAWAYGIPVISTPVGGLPDVIEEGKNCLTFNFGDVDGLSQKLRTIMNDASLRKSMSKYERRFVETKFSLNSINECYAKLYSQLGC